MRVDLSKYETVKERKKRFYNDFPGGCIIVELLNPEKIEDYALFRAAVFTDKASYLEKAPKAVGYALEIRDKELSRNSKGGTYESVNYSSWTENCEESAIGRALDNAGYSGNDKCSREEMEKAERMNKLNQSVTMTEPSPEELAQAFESAPDTMTVTDTKVKVDVVIPFGKHKGKRLSEVPPSILLSYAQFLESQPQASQKALDLVAQVKEFLS